MNIILDTILKDTYSLNQLKHKLSVLKTHLTQNFFGSELKAPLQEKDESYLKSLPATLLSQFNKDNLSSVFTNLEAEISKLPTLTIYLTFESDDSSLQQVGTFARKMFGSKLLLGIRYDPKLIAGAALVWKGMYRDYSLRTRIEEKKGIILQQFKKFLR